MPELPPSVPAGTPAADTLAGWARHLGRRPDRVDEAAVRAALTDGSIPDALAAAAARSPERTLTVADATTTFAQLHDRVRRQAAVLLSRGLRPGDRVAINAPSSLDLVVAYLAVLRAGLVAVLANPGYTAAELDHLLRHSGVRLLLSATPAAADAPGLGLPELAAAAERAEPLRVTPGSPSADDVALLAFTSGSTGQPKAVPLTHAHLLSSIRAAMWAWRWQDSDVLVHCLPLFHQHGLSGVHASLVAGTSARILPRFDGPALIEAIETSGGTVLFGVPAIHRRLLELDAGRLATLGRLRVVTSGSGPLSPGLATAFREATGIELLERYGLTESGLDLSNPYDGPRLPGTVGYPLPGVEARLTDAEGREVPAGEDGEIVLRGPQVFDGYLDDEAATRAAFWPGGWFRTGDLGRTDEDGRFRISGRLKELVITGGMNVSPVEVETVVEELPWVGESAVAGVPSEEWGEEVAVWIVPAAGTIPRPDQVVEHCRGRLAAYKCPKQVYVVDALPRNAMGKVVRNQLVVGPEGGR